MPDSVTASNTDTHAHHEAYDVAERIAVGPAGIVYRAVQRGTKREVVFKVLMPEATHPLDTTHIAALKSSVDLVQHPCIAEWIEAYDDPEGFVLVFDFKKGIAGHVFPSQQRKLTPAEGRLLAARLCGVVLAGEQAGQPHGDIKPSNIVISDLPGQGLSVQVLDWSLSTCRAEHPPESLLCMAPERLQGGPPSLAGDLFSVGATLTFLLTGCYPVHGSTPEEVLATWQRFDPSAIAKVRPDLDEHFCKWLAWLMRLPPQDRPSSASQARDVLEQVIAYASVVRTTPAAPVPEKKSAAPAASAPAPPARPPAARPPPPAASAPTATSIKQTVSQKTAAPAAQAPAADATAGTPVAVPGETSTPQTPQKPKTPRAVRVMQGVWATCAVVVIIAAFCWWAQHQYGPNWREELASAWHEFWRPAPKPPPLVATPEPPPLPAPPAKPVPVPKPVVAAKPPTAAKPAPPKTAPAPPVVTIQAREPFAYPAGSKLDGAGTTKGWLSPWKASNIGIAQSTDKKTFSARLGGETEASARREIAPFAGFEARGLVLVFAVAHPGADGPILALNTLSAPDAPGPAGIIIKPMDGKLLVSINGGSQTMEAPAAKGFRVAVQWIFKKQPDGKYEVDIGLFLNPDVRLKPPTLKSPTAHHQIKDFVPPTNLALTLSTQGVAKRGVAIYDVRIAQTFLDALR